MKITSLLICLALSGSSMAAEIGSKIVTHVWSTSGKVNPDSKVKLVDSHMVDLGNAVGSRLFFDQKTKLGKGVYVRVTSLQSKKNIVINDRILARYRHSTPYFSGGKLNVQVFAEPGMKVGMIALRAAEIHFPRRSAVKSICGDKDDRALSDVKQIARMMQTATDQGGCTATMIGPTCAVTAGHCVGVLNIAQFNVPVSNDNGRANYPAPEDQYPLAKIIDSKSGGIGDDWAVFRMSENPVTGKLPGIQQGMFKMTDKMPQVGDAINITGFGVADGKMNVSQKTHDGKMVSMSNTTLRYDADTTGGNSGSSVIDQASGNIIGIHTHGGCDRSAGSANHGTNYLAHKRFFDAVQKCLAEDQQLLTKLRSR